MGGSLLDEVHSEAEGLCVIGGKFGSRSADQSSANLVGDHAVEAEGVVITLKHELVLP